MKKGPILEVVAYVVLPVFIAAIVGCEKPASTPYGEALERPVTLNVSQSPGGERLTTQYAVIAVCEAVNVPYQWDKSAQNAGDLARRFIAPLNVTNKAAREVLVDVLTPLGLSYDIDSNGLYISR